MRALPTGTVTLVFSDIEGSTRLLTHLGPAYAEALSRQRQILRRAWAQHGGIELGTEGDSFFVVFPRAVDGVTAAVAAQRELSRASWPGQEPVRVRMGLHTGTPMLHDDGYVGMDVHRAARIAAAAHGGQIVVSEATARLLDAAALPLRDLGRHRFKDLPQPERVFQVCGPGLAEDFPPLRSLGSATTLPRPPTPIVGRAQDLLALEGLVDAAAARVVTLTGPGGTGKTRLALALAERRATRYPDGVFFVPLETVTDAETMWTSISAALELPPEGRIPPGLFDHVAHTTALLVLDNLEQIDGAGVVVTELAAAAPSLMIVATSRHPLHAHDEQEFPVVPLALPPTHEAATRAPETLADYGAVDLFVRRARLVRPDFRIDEGNREAVLDLCRRLDGLPLALELVTARLRLLSPQALLRRLDDALDIADKDPRRTGRQSTLRAAIDWSYDLLDEESRRLLRCLAVFAGGADLDAVEAVAEASGLGQGDVLAPLERLVEASLATAREGVDGEPRVHLLNTVRAYAWDALGEAGEAAAAQDAAATWFAERLRDVEGQGYFRDRNRWRDRVEADLDNYRATLTWLLDPARTTQDPRRVDLARMTICGLTLEILSIQGYLDEARARCEEARDARDDPGSLSRAAVELALSDVVSAQGEHEEGAALLASARPVLLAAEPDDVFGPMLVHLLRNAALVSSLSSELVAGRLDRARAHAEVGLALPDLPDPLPAFLSLALADVHIAEGNAEAALARQVEAAAVARRVGDELLLAGALWGRAQSLLQLHRTADAESALREVTPLFVALRAPGPLASFAEVWVQALVDQNRDEDAAELLGAAEAMRERVGVPRDDAAEATLEPTIDTARTRLGDAWAAGVDRGRSTTVEQVLQRLMSVT